MTHTWPKLRLKFAVDKIGSGKTPLGGATTYINSGIMLLRSQNIHFDGLRLEDVVFIDIDTDAQMASTRVQPDDVLLNITGASLGRCTIAPKDISPANVNQHVCILRPDKKHVEPRFLNMALQSAPVQRAIFAGENGSSREGLTFEQVGNFEIALPPLPDQQAIADYLDQETARLDGLVAAKERVLGLLAEKRRALITRAVTRGLDPNAFLRDSGIPWLGEIPAHWTATRMKFIATEPLAYGANEAALEDDPTFPRFVRITDVDPEGNLRDETFKSLPPEVAEPYLLRDGDVLLARSGATVGKAFIYKPAWGIACFAGYLIRCRCNTALMQPDFLFAYTQTEPYWWQVREGIIQATIQNFSAEKYGDLVVTVPPLEEQKAIIAHIAAEASKLDALRAATERTIVLLKERRTALIAAAVTGKLDMQGAERHLDVVADEWAQG